MTAVIRRQYLGGAAATLGGLLAAACGEPEVKYVEKIVEKIVEKPAPAAEPKTVIFDTDWLEGVRGDIINQSLEEWAGLYPHVTIDKRNIQNPEGGIVPKVTTLMAADDMGDLMLWAGFFFTYWAKRGIFADISPYLKQFKLSLDDYFYIPEHVIYEGRTYGWPFQGGPKDFMYNKSLFQKHGVPEPDDTWTWDTVVEVGKKLTSPEENVYALWDHRWYMVETLMYAIGDGPRTKDNTQWVLDGPVGVEAITFLHDLIFRHQIVPSRTVQPREEAQSEERQLRHLVPQGQPGLLQGRGLRMGRDAGADVEGYRQAGCASELAAARDYQVGRAAWRDRRDGPVSRPSGRAVHPEAGGRGEHRPRVEAGYGHGYLAGFQEVEAPPRHRRVRAPLRESGAGVLVAILWGVGCDAQPSLDGRSAPARRGQRSQPPRQSGH